MAMPSVLPSTQSSKQKLQISSIYDLKMSEVANRMKISWYAGLHCVVLLYLAFLTLYTLIYFNFGDNVDPEILFVKKYKYRYLTMWTMWAQFIYSSLAVAYDIQGTSIDNKYLADLIPKVKSYLLTAIVFPSSVFTAFTFWILYNIDINLVLPPQLDLLIPKWYNHCVHTNVLVIPLLEFFFTTRLPNYKFAFIISSLYYWIYDSTVIYTYFKTSKWLYHIFAVLDWKSRCIYMLFNYFITIGAMHLAMILQKYVIKNKFIRQVNLKES